MNKIEIENAIRDFVVANVSIDESKVIPANENSPRPERTYITIYVNLARGSEHDNVGTPDDDGDALIENEYMVMASIQAFGDDAFDVLGGLRTALMKVTVKDSLRAAGIPYIRTSNGVTDLTETVGTKFEGRAGLDLEFRTVYAVTDNVGVIQSVQGTATHETGTDTQYENDYQIGA